MQLPERSWSRWLVTLLLTGGLLGAALGFVIGSSTAPGYDASAFLLVTPSGRTPVQTGEIQYAQALSHIVADPAVLAAGGDDADLPADPRRVRADPSPNAPLIELVVNARDADAARRRAQAAAEAVATYTQDRDDLLGFRAVVLAPATNGRPAGLSLAAYIAAGAAMGAVLGALAAMLRGERRAVVAEPRPRDARAEVGETGNATPVGS